MPERTLPFFASRKRSLAPVQVCWEDVINSLFARVTEFWHTVQRMKTPCERKGSWLSSSSTVMYLPSTESSIPVVDAVLFFNLVGLFPVQLQNAMKGCRELTGQGRFHQKQVCTHIVSCLNVDRSVGRGKDHHRQVFEPFTAPDFHQALQPVFVGHVQIQKQQVGNKVPE